MRQRRRNRRYEPEQAAQPVFGAAGKRQKNIAIFARRERLGQQPRLAGAAENQDAGSSHV